jgi:hypothetical protein
MFRSFFVPIIRSYQLYTWKLVCFMQVMWPLPKRVRFQPDSPRQRSHNLHETYQLPCLQLITPDDGHRRCLKHIEFRDRIKFWIFDASCLFTRRLSVQNFSSTTILKCSHNTIVLGLIRQISLILLLEVNSVHEITNAMKSLKQLISLNMLA